MGSRVALFFAALARRALPPLSCDPLIDVLLLVEVSLVLFVLVKVVLPGVVVTLDPGVDVARGCRRRRRLCAGLSLCLGTCPGVSRSLW